MAIQYKAAILLADTIALTISIIDTKEIYTNPNDLFKQIFAPASDTCSTD